MTELDLDRFAARWELEHPVSMDDLAHIKAELDKEKPVGTYSEVILRGARVELVVGSVATFSHRWLEVSGAPAQTGLASALARR